MTRRRPVSPSTAQWIGSTWQCRSCSERVSQNKVGPNGFCVLCHRLTMIFPAGEVHRRRRGHAFLTREMLRSIPVLYATESVPVPVPDKQLHAHYFAGGSDRYVAELDPGTGNIFGYADLGHGQWGYFSLVEMEAVLAHGWLVIERELDFRIITAKQLGIA